MAPFFWHSTDSARGYDLKVVLNVSWSSEPGARSFAIWPLFYGSNKFGWAIPFLLTFNVGDSKTGSQYGALAGLYWWKRSQRGAFDFGFLPPYVSSRDAAGAFTWAAPLNFYWRNADDRNLLALPLFFKNVHKTGNSVYTWLGYSRREGLEQSGSAFWLYWYGKDDADKSRYDVLFPLLWSFRTGESRSTVFFPLLWSFSSPKSSTTIVFPLYLGHHSGSSYFNVVFPLWWSGGDVDTGRSFKLLMPFFFWQKDAKAGTSTLVTLPYSFTRDRTAGTFSGFILPLLTYWHREPQSELNFVTPLYVSHYSKTDHSMTRVIGLIGYHREDPEGTTTTLFPLFWRFRDAATGASATLLLPIGGYRSGPRDETLVIGPFYWRAYKPEGWNAGLFPLADVRQQQGDAPRDRLPAVLALRRPAVVDHGARAPLLLAPRPRRLRARRRRCYFAGNDRGEQLHDPVPAGLALRERAPRRRRPPSRRSATTTPTPTAGASPPVRSCRCCSRGRGSSARTSRCSRCSGTSRIAPPTRRPRSPRSTGTGAGAARRPTPCSRCFITGAARGRAAATRPASRCSRSFTTGATRTRRCWSTPLYASARGPDRSAGFAGPYIWYDDKELSLRFVPFLHTDVTNHETRRADAPVRPVVHDGRARAPGARAVPPVRHATPTSKRHDTWVVPTYFRMRRNNGDRVDALLPFYWQSTFGDRTTAVIGPFYTAPRPAWRTTGSCRCSFTRATPSGASRSSRRCCRTAATSTTARTSGS